MGLLDFLNPSAAPQARATARLAEVAGRVEALAERLARHAEMCSLPAMRAEVGEIASAQRGNLKVLKTILADNTAWPRPPAPIAHEGLSNWERLSRDLDELVEITADTARAALFWEQVDARTAETLSAIAAEESTISEKLRKIALKCDPQALD